ncbi:hypothetical protein WJX79_004533 [Trebouxia sp. C0005]
MDEFTDSLYRERVSSWSEQYIDYEKLQSKVDAAAEPNQDEASCQQRRTEVETALDKEIKKLADKHLQMLQQNGKHVTDLLQYISLNVRGIRKVLNKFSRSNSPQKPKDGCMSLEVDRPHHPGSHSFQGTSLPKEVAEQLDDMFEHTALESAAHSIKKQYEQLQSWQSRLQTSKEWSGDADQQMHEILHRLDRSEYWAKRNTNLVHTISQRERWAGIYEKAPSSDKVPGGLLGLAINCACAALYMANYQLILPDIEKYLGHIEASSSWAGIAIGCCDVATLPGALGYSLWTNKSFKAPLLAAALACICGNVLYGAGYDAKALWILLASRLLVGFGSARTVNRRYIADFVSKGNRTKASAAFVTSSAVGMACGPLLALPLSYLPTTSLGPISIDPVTAGGWVMGLLWLTFLLLTLLMFEEPKSGGDSKHESRNNDSESEPLMSNQESNPDVEQGQGQSEGSNINSGNKSQEEDDSGSFKQQLPPTILMFCVLFLVKLVQQGFLSSLSVFTIKLYGWSSSQSGLTLAAYGFTLIPLNLAVGKASNTISDRLFSVVLLAAIGLGSALCTCSGKPMWLFFLGGAFVFMGSMTLEGSAMSLLSKVMHSSLAEGTFNTGLLTTEAGGFGRLAGNLANSAFSRLSGTDTPSQVYSFGHYLFGLLTILTVGNTVYFGSMWKKVKD